MFIILFKISFTQSVFVLKLNVVENSLIQCTQWQWFMQGYSQLVRVVSGFLTWNKIFRAKANLIECVKLKGNKNK